MINIFDKRNEFMRIFLDIANAFNKLGYVALNLLEAYQWNQRIRIFNVISSYKNIKCGVPQKLNLDLSYF